MVGTPGTGMSSLTCAVAGAGPAVVFIHAFPLNRRMWFPQIARLRGQARVIAVDLPGFGRTPPVPTATIDDFADAVAGLLDRLEIGPAVVVGCSMGGYVAQALAVRHPSRVGLVREMIGEATPQGLITAAAAMAARADMRPALPAIPCPTAVIAGTEDAIIPIAEAEEMAARLPRGRCVRLEGTGHLANLEMPDDFTAAVGALLRGELP